MQSRQKSIQAVKAPQRKTRQRKENPESVEVEFPAVWPSRNKPVG
jgi:hypothetical protein